MIKQSSIFRDLAVDDIRLGMTTRLSDGRLAEVTAMVRFFERDEDACLHGVEAEVWLTGSQVPYRYNNDRRVFCEVIA